MRGFVRLAANLMSPQQQAPFSDQLEPCFFYRVTPVVGPIIGITLMLITVIVISASALTGHDVAWFTLVSGVGTGAFCALLPRTAGLWPGSETLTGWEIDLDRRRERMALRRH